MIDLHTHSTFSDGMCSPTQLVEAAVAAGLQALAITDHDSVASWPELKRVAEKHGIEPVPAVELAADYKPGTLHILGYYIDPQSRVLRQHLDWLRQGRVARVEEIFGKLNMMGLRLRWDEVLKYAKGESVGRVHIAKAMVARKYCDSVKEAFSQYLGRSRPAYVVRRTLDPAGCIDLIHEAKGVAVIAHPYTLQLTAGLMQEFLEYLKELGIDGIEVFYPEHSDRQVQTYIRMAYEFNLIMTGGSDYHAGPEHYKRLGRGALDQEVPSSLLEFLRYRKAELFG